MFDDWDFEDHFDTDPYTEEGGGEGDGPSRQVQLKERYEAVVLELMAAGGRESSGAGDAGKSPSRRQSGNSSS